MLRLLIRKTACEMDDLTEQQIERTLSDKVSTCNYWANRLCCEAADRAMQAHGGRLFTPQAVRAHFSPPSPLSHH
jgi:alkylation response protein AidB-like acyl-CoA dehydrogenase